MAQVERLVVGPLSTNCYIVKSGVELSIIDPGGDGDEILERTRDLGGTVVQVIDTHGHVDHIAGNRELVEATGADLLVHEFDAEMLTGPDTGLAEMMGLCADSPPATRLLREGDKVKMGELGFTVVHTPGHTAGSICLVAPEMAFTGDTLFLDSIGRTDFPGGSLRQMKESLGKLQRVLHDETVIYPGHGEPGRFGRARLVNPFLGSRLELWQ